MKGGWTRVSISSLLMTFSMLAAVPTSLRLVATWQERIFWVTDRHGIENYWAPMGFASLALICIGLIVTWTSFLNRDRSAWLSLLVLAWVFYFPVLIVPLLRVNWDVFFENVLASSTLREYTLHLLGFLSMLVALLLPIKDFFSRRKVDPCEPVCKEVLSSRS